MAITTTQVRLHNLRIRLGHGRPRLKLPCVRCRTPANSFCMAYLNENYLKLKAGYLFPEIARRVKAFCDANPESAKRLIRCGIGDVT